MVNEKSNLGIVDNFYNMYYCFYHSFFFGRKYSRDVASVFGCDAYSRHLVLGSHCSISAGALEVKKKIA